MRKLSVCLLTAATAMAAAGAVPVTALAATGTYNIPGGKMIVIGGSMNGSNCEVPGFPGVNIPGINIPGINIPGSNIPDNSLPAPDFPIPDFPDNMLPDQPGGMLPDQPGGMLPEKVMEGWMNSSGHRANILNSSYTSIGVGHYQNASGVNYWTQLFIR